MRRAALLSFVAAVCFAGAFAFEAAGGDRSGGRRDVDVNAANARTAQARSVHYTVTVTLRKQDRPMTLHIDGGSSRDKLVAHLSMGAMTGSVLMSKPFLYESAPSGIVVVGSVNWLRLHVSAASPRSKTMSTLRSLTPLPLLHVVAEAKLHPVGRGGAFAGPVAYDDPVVRTSLHQLAAGLEFRGLQVHVAVGRDGLIRGIRITGRTADGKTTLNLRARLFGFGKPVSVNPPQPGSFVDPTLEQLQA